MEIYLDNSATTKPLDEVVAAVNHMMTENYGNPSALHRRGLEAEHAVKKARSQVASLFNTGNHDVIFTSGGTESNNLAIFGSLSTIRDTSRPLVTSAIEHPSVLNIFKHLEKNGRKVIYIRTDAQGFIDLDEFKKALDDHPALVSIMTVNNEIGSIQPIAEIARLIEACDEKPVFHTDAVQAFGKIPLPSTAVDLMSVSAHKFHGPKGIGGLFVKKGVRLAPLMFGGGQEGNLRPGTENAPAIVGMGTAAAWAEARLSENMDKLNQLKASVINGILKEISGVRINSPISPQFAPHILSVSFKGIRGEVLLHSLEQDGIYVATRSACSSKKKSRNHVLEALQLSPDEAEGTIRISFSSFNRQDELDYVIEKLKHHVASIRRITGWRG